MSKLAESEIQLSKSAIRRIHKLALLFAGLGALASAMVWGWRSGVGFLLAAAGSILVFHLLYRMVQTLPDEPPPPSRSLAFSLIFRHLVVILACYVIVKVFGASPLPTLLGLFVPVAAILAEILYELSLWSNTKTG